MAIDVDKAKEELLLLHDRLRGEEQRLTDSLATSLEEMGGDEAYDQHMGDVGTITFDREMDESIQGNTERLLAQVNRALEKFEEGNYGRCDRCGKPIEEDRLRAIPYATLCMNDQKLLERSEQI